ncbi:Protein of unknown function [Gryllus bimaculatus]|nr:Protein of unknown function [Gryllus bimaculatus]
MVMHRDPSRAWICRALGRRGSPRFVQQTWLERVYSQGTSVNATVGNACTSPSTPRSPIPFDTGSHGKQMGGRSEYTGQ